MALRPRVPRAGAVAPVAPGPNPSPTYGRTWQRSNQDLTLSQQDGISFVNPSAGQTKVIMYTTTNVTITECRGVVKGSSTPVAFMALYYGPTRDGVGNTQIASPTITSTQWGNTSVVFQNNTAVTMNVSSLASNWTSSNSGWTVTAPSGLTDSYWKTITSVNNGKFYAELWRSTGGADGTGIGMNDGSVSTGGFLANNLLGFICWESGGAAGRYANNLVFSLPNDPGGYNTPLNNDVICMAVDLDSRQVWSRINGGNWLNNASANPANGNLGQTFPFLTATNLYLAGGSSLGTGRSLTMRVYPNTWSYSPPTGFYQFPTGFNNTLTIPAGNYVWATVGGVSGTVNECFIAIRY